MTFDGGQGRLNHPSFTREDEIWLDCPACGLSDAIPTEGAKPYVCTECGARIDIGLSANDLEEA